MMTLGSLFSGSGSFELAGAQNGITPVFASEVEPYAIAVTTSRFPQMQHLGNVTEIRGDQIPPVDVLTSGFPCQDVSVAGKQAGLHEGKRSSLFFEAIRIIQEMRCATHGKYPKFAVFENVPGLFSSARGADFQTVLQAFVSVASQSCGCETRRSQSDSESETDSDFSLCDDSVLVPEPPKGKWLHAGEIMGDHYSLAWRVQGAEHWGVPQRRNRIYLVVDFTARRAGKVLFEQTGVRGNSPARGAPRQRTAADVEGSVAGSAGELNAPCVCNESGQGCRMLGFGCLRAEGENRLSRPGHLAYYDQPQQIAYALQGNTIDCAATANCNGCGWKANVSYTINTIDRHAVCYQDAAGMDKPICTDARGNGTGQVCANVTGDHERRVTDYTNIITYGGDKAGTLDASYYKGAGARNGKEREFIAERKAGRKYIVRRLSTTECARLQGQPDCWAIPVRKENMTDEEATFWERVRETHAAIKGTRYKPFVKREQLVRWYNRLHTDSAEYKLYGNGIALPCAVYVLRGIAQELSEEERK